MKTMRFDQDRQPDPLERKLELLEELDRLESERRTLAAKLSKMLVPALLFGSLAPLLWSPPIRVHATITLLLILIPMVYGLNTEEGRSSRATWRRIQHLRRELRFLGSFGHFSDEHQESLKP